MGCGRHPVRPVKTSSKKLVVLTEPFKERGFKPYEINGERYYPMPDAEGFVQTGTASWYGEKFHGRRTASGEVFDMYRKSAAHKILPLGTYVKITNLKNRQEVVVRINDRGPFVKGRVIDLSYAAAKEIGMIEPGVTKVKVVAMGKEVGKIASPLGKKPVLEMEDFRIGEFTVQVGAFTRKDNALRLSDRLKVLFDYVDVKVVRDIAGERFYRVRVSKSKTLTQARAMEQKLKSIGFEEAFIVSL